MQRPIAILVWMLGVSGFTTACMTSSAAGDATDRPAIINRPDAASRAELNRIVALALSAPKLTLADSALTKESQLTIERSRVNGANGVRLNGREFDRPEQFQLVRNGRSCILVRMSTKQRWPLRKTSCAVIAANP